MKRTTIFAVALLISITSFATGSSKKSEASTKMAIANNSANQFKLVYFEKAKGMVNVYLKDEKGKILHRANVKNTEGFAQKFDLNSLPEGDYTFAVKNAKGDMAEEKVTVAYPKSEINFNADVLDVNDDKKFRLAVLNKDNQALSTTISIYDAKGSEIHKETVESLSGFRKMYDMAKVDADTFRFEITNSTGTKYITTQ